MRVRLTLLALYVFLLASLSYFAMAFPAVDYVPPTLPNNSATNLNWTYINITSSENLTQALLEWGNSSGFTNISMSNSSGGNLTWYVNVTGLADRTYNYTIWAQNSTGNWNQSVRRFVTIDTIAPSIAIQSPQNATYINKVIDLNVSADEPVDTWRYSINDTGNTTFTPNTTITVSAGANNITVYANDTAGNMNRTIVYFTLNTTLDVSLAEPSTVSPTDFVQNTAFLVNATVVCRQGSCGNVAGTVRYNKTSANPDTPINITSGAQPFYIQEASPASTKSCPNNPLSEGQFCNLTWTVNATDSTLSYWKLGVNFSSDSGWTVPNTTSPATVSIVPCFVDLTVNWQSINFQNPLIPDTYQNPALGNADPLYNITVNSGSCNTDLYIKGTDMQNSTLGYSLGAGNLTWSNSSNTYSSSFNMTQAYSLFKFNAPPITNVTMWYWINVPPIFAANYNGTVFIQGVKSGSSFP
ncbi:Uncharacterised protein [uncultured archaeon]|nr:Uncharacterised protein [uncultured archaeon]